MRDAAADDSRARLGTSEASCSLSPSQVAGQPSSDGSDDPAILDISVSRDTVSKAAIKSGHTHCTVRWFLLVEDCLDVCCELEEGRCSRVSGSDRG